MMSECLTYHLEEAKRWADRAEENYARAERYKDPFCIRTMRNLGRSAELYAERAALLAMEHVPSSIEEPAMQSRGGLHPYRAALFFILREQHNPHRVGRQARAAMEAGDIKAIAKWQTVRCIAHSFGKSGHDVARDLIDTYCALEHYAP